MATTDYLPPADDLTTDELARLLCHRIIPGATSTALLGDDWLDHHECGLPRSWTVQAPNEARRRRPMDDSDRHMVYKRYSDQEIIESLLVKLGFDLEVIDAAVEGEPEALLEAIYDGLRHLEAESAKRMGRMD